jgi:hypothetical protein
MKLFRRRKKEKPIQEEVEHSGLEIVDFETNKTTPLELETYKGELVIKKPNTILFGKGNVLKEFTTYFNDPHIQSAEITRDDFANLITEIRKLEEQKANDKYFQVIQELTHALSNKGAKTNEEGKSDSREPIQEDDTARTDSEKEPIQKPDRRKRQKNPLHNSPEQVVLPQQQQDNKPDGMLSTNE